jgi:hypothetical protein
MWTRANRPEHSVGNGGFLLLSKRMADYVYDRRRAFRIMTDMHYCRDNRVRLEREIGAKWAPPHVAAKFSFEHGTQPHRSQSPSSFGYHDIFNWPLALPHDEVIRRVRLVMQNHYIVTHTPKLKLLAQSWPWVRAEIGNLEYDAAARHTPPIHHQYHPDHPTHHIGLPHHTQRPQLTRQRMIKSVPTPHPGGVKA